MARLPDPDPNTLHPVPGQPRVVLLRPLIRSPLIEVGEFTYYDDPDHAEDFQRRNVLHHYGPDRLVIGRFCALAAGVTFIMNGANHRMDGVSTFPFPIMGGSWAEHLELITGLPSRGDTLVGHDVWIGGRVTVLPGVRIGSGAVVATGSLVSADVPDYAIAAGNPARVIRSRFSAADIAVLLDIAWWNWPIEAITANIRTIAAGSVDELHAVAPDRHSGSTVAAAP